MSSGCCYLVFHLLSQGIHPHLAARLPPCFFVFQSYVPCSPTPLSEHLSSGCSPSLGAFLPRLPGTWIPTHLSNLPGQREYSLTAASGKGTHLTDVEKPREDGKKSAPAGEVRGQPRRDFILELSLLEAGGGERGEG